MKRRAFLRGLGKVSALAACPSGFASAAEPGEPQARPTKSEEDAIRSIAEDFLKRAGIKGMSIAYGRDGHVAFEQGYGFADADGKEPVTPDHRFRIASISKPITSSAVMMCLETGLLKLDGKVFGPGSILGDAYGSKLPGNVLAITLDHLLTHTSGGWTNDKNDPMFRHPEMNHLDLITWTLANQQQIHPPGTNYAYSNFGYCVLGRVLEKVARQSYETLVTQHVLSKCGIEDMRIAGNTLKERQPQEVMYLTEKPDAAYGMNVARMDSHGGWIATARDLMLFSSQLYKTSPRNGLLAGESVRTMTTPGTVNPGYARGWSVNKVPNWWHGGSLPGTSTIMVRTAKGICWAGLLNGRTENIGGELDRLMWKMGRAVPSWQL
jgi:CubicO group peptidase (beta-lactamase class C family)